MTAMHDRLLSLLPLAGFLWMVAIAFAQRQSASEKPDPFFEDTDSSAQQRLTDESGGETVEVDSSSGQVVDLPAIQPFVAVGDALNEPDAQLRSPSPSNTTKTIAAAEFSSAASIHEVSPPDPENTALAQATDHGSGDRSSNSMQTSLNVEPMTSDDRPAEQVAYLKGNASFEARDYNQALEHYNQAIALNPNFAEAYNNRGNLYYVLRNYGQAIADYSKAIALNANYPRAHFNRGNAHYALQQYEAAVANFSQAITLNPKYAEAYHNRGNLYSGLKRYQEAIDDFDTALEINPRFAAAYNSIGDLFQRMKKFDEAIENYNQSLAIAPNQPETFNNRGNAYYATENYSKALENYDHALALDPNYAEAFYNRGITNRNLGHHQQAQADLQTAVRLAQNQGNKALFQQLQAIAR